MVLQLLKEEHMLLVQGTAFNWVDKRRFRIVFLPDRDQLIKGHRQVQPIPAAVAWVALGLEAYNEQHNDPDFLLCASATTKLYSDSRAPVLFR